LAPGLAADIEALAGIERGSATPGERRSAEWVAGRLREQGAVDVRLERFRYQRTFAHAQAIHFGAGALAALRGRRLLAAAALASFELEYSGRLQWLRRFLPAGEGTNVIARLPASGPPERTLVLVAHHDAARTGLMWDPRLSRAGDRAAARTGKRASLALLPELAFVGAALGLRRLPAAVLAFAVALSLDQARSPVVPGANDNASGVAGVLELVGRFARERPPGLEVVVLVCGCEESGMGGMLAWLDAEGAALDRERTLVVGLDTIGSGEPVVLEAEGGLWPVRYREEDVAAGERAGLRRWRLGAWTDPALASLAGLRALSILSVRDGGFPNYHLPSDLPESVDIGCVEACVDAAQAIAWAA
jgi:acetylornithine deacetylase/succinyl-diaminopimelate desuccinylase-like protein